jgi:hypothetical protein
LIWIEHANYNPTNPVLDQPVCARHLWMPACRAWLKCRVNRRTSECSVYELLLQQRELGVIARFKISSATGPEDSIVLHDNGSNQRMRTVIFRYAPPCLFDRETH